MFAVKRKLRIPVMIKERNTPVFLHMTVLTLWAKHAFVIVVLFVAGVAGHGSTLELLVFMTVITSHVRMLSTKWKTRLAMVKFDLVPLVFRVTIRAGWTERSPMTVIFFMARETRRWRMAELHPWKVAGLTLRFGVRALQHKIGLPVIKCFPIEQCDIRASSFMFGVTVLTLPNFTNPAVKALLLS